MSKTVDERVVSLEFDNSKFKDNADESLKQLEELKEALKLEDASKQFDKVTDAANKVDLSSIADSLSTISSRFSTTGIVATTALQNITTAAMNAGTKILSYLNAPFAQIKSGGFNRALNIENAKSTIEGLGVVWKKGEGIYKNINDAVSGTAYGFDEAANVASQLVASSVQVGDEMDHALKAISGVAAMTHSSYSDIGGIFTTIAGNGRLMTEQLNQFSYRGLNAAAALGKQLGVTESEVREMVSDGKIQFKDFANAMYDAFGEQAFKANDQFEGAMANMKAALSRIGADFYSAYLTDAVKVFNSLRVAINNLHTALGSETTGFIGSLNQAFKIGTKILTNVIDGIGSNLSWLTPWLNGLGNIVKMLGNQLYFVESAFKAVFNEDATVVLTEIGKRFESLTSYLYDTASSSTTLKDIVSGILTIFKTVGKVIGSLMTVLSPIAKVLFLINYYIFQFMGVVGKLITSLGQVLDKTQAIERIAEALKEIVLTGLSAAIAGIIIGLGTVINFLSKLDLSPVIQAFNEFYEVAYNAFNKVREAAVKFFAQFGGIGNSIKGILTTITNVMKGFVKAGEDGINGLIKGFGDNSLIGKLLKLIASIGTAIINAFRAVTGWHSPWTTFVEASKDAIRGLIQGFQDRSLNEILKSVLQELGSTIVFIVEESIDLVQLAYDKLKVILDDTKEEGKSILDQIKDYAAKSEAVKAIKQTLSNIKDAWMDFVNVISKYTSKLNPAKITLGVFILSLTALLLSLTRLGNMASLLVKNLNSIVAKIGTILGASTFTDRISRYLGNFQTIAKSISMIMLSLTALTYVMQQDKSGKAMQGAIAALIAVFIGLGTLTAIMGKIKMENFLQFGKSAKLVIALSASVSAIAMSMAGLIFVINSIEGDYNSKVMTTIGAMVSVIVMLVALVAAIAVLSKTPINLTSGIISIVGIAIALKIVASGLGDAINAMDAIDWGGVKSKIENNYQLILGCLAAITAMAFVIGKAGVGFLSVAAGIIIMARAMNIFVKAAQAIGDADLSSFKSKLENNAVLISGIVAALGSILLATSELSVGGGKDKWGFSVGLSRNIGKLAAAMVALGAACVLIVAALKMVPNDISEKRFNSFFTLINILQTFAISMAVLTSNASLNGKGGVDLGKNLGSVAKALLSFVASVAVLAIVINALGNTDAAVLAQGITYFTEIIGAMALLIGAASFIKSDGAASLKAISAMLIALSVCLTILTYMGDVSSMESAANSLATIVGALAVSIVAVEAFSKNSKGLSSIAVMGTAIAGLVGAVIALWALRDVDPNTLIATSEALIVVIGGISVIAGLLGQIENGLLGAGTLAILGADLVIFSLALKQLASVDSTALQTNALTMTAVAAALLIFAGVVSSAAGPVALGLLVLAGCAAVVFIFAEALNVLANAFNLVSVSMPIFASGITMLSTLDLLGIGGSLIVVGAGLAVIGATGVALAIVNPLIIGLSSGLMLLNSTLLLLSSTIVRVAKAFQQSVQIISSTLGVFKTAGQDALRGLSNGLGDNSLIGNITNKAKNIGNKILDAFREVTGWHSPWSTMLTAAKDLFNGLTQGLSDGGALSNLAAKAKNVGSTITKWIANGCDFQQLSSWISGNIQNLIGGATSSISGMFGGSSSSSGWHSITEDIEAANEAMSKSTEESFDLSESLDDLGTSAGGAGGSASDAAEDIDDLFDAAKDATHVVQLFAEQYLKTQGVLDDDSAITGATEAVTQLATTMWESSLTYDEQLEEMEMTSEEKLTKIKEYWSDLYTGIRDGISGSINLYEKFDNDQYTSGQETLQNMRTQIEGTQEWAKDMKTLIAKGFDKRAIVEFLKEGTSSLGIVKGLLELGANDISNFNDLTELKYTIPQQFTDEFLAEMANVGFDAEQGLANGLEAGTVVALQTAQLSAQAITDTYHDAWQEHSPSVLFKLIGSNLMEGLRMGMTTAALSVVTEARIIAEATLNMFKNYLKYETFYNMGTFVIQGLINGMSDLQGELQAKADEIASIVAYAVAKKNEIASPSKLMYRYGKYIDLGLSKGISHYATRVQNASENMADGSIDAVRDAMTRISDIVSNNVDVDPTITPVLDLSNVTSGVRSINSMFGNRSINLTGSAKAAQDTANQINARRYTSNQNGQNKVGSSISFVQNNYSPKSLSRVEIYRQTRNQIARMKGALSNS